MSTAAGLWSALWRRAAPHARLPGTGFVVPTVASDAPLRAMLEWRPDWKTVAIAAILRHRRGRFIDVGANVGQTLLDFLSASDRSTYLGFEPNLTCYQHLAAFISANELQDCRVMPAALGAKNGIAVLYRLGGDVDSGATTIAELRPRASVECDPCCIFRFDDLGDSITEDEIALVKVDVEGGELETLRGMEASIRRSSPWILCEVLHRDELADPDPYRRRCAELMRLLRDLDYEVRRIVQNPEGSKVQQLESVTEFPDVVWDSRSIRSCDYLFVPASDVEAAHEVLVG